MAEPTFAAARELAAMLARRELSSRELLEHYLAARRAPESAAQRGGDARRRARAGARRRGRRRARARRGWGPAARRADDDQGHLRDGGLRTTAAPRRSRTHVPTTTRSRSRGWSTRARRLRQDQRARPRRRRPDATTRSSASTNNPWDPTRTPGGSSGGAAASLAAGLTAVRARQRHRRLDPHAVALVRRLRPQADATASSRSAVTSRGRRARSPSPT